MIGLSIGIGSLRDNSSHRSIRQSLLGSAGVGICPRLIKGCKFGLEKQQAGRYFPDTKLDLIRFWPLPFRELMWHLIAQVNNGDIATYNTVFDPRRGKRRHFIPFLFYALLYSSIDSNLVTLANISLLYESVCRHTYYPFLRKPLFR